MTKLPLTLALATFVLPVVAHANDVAWALDSAHTRVGFTVRHLGITKVHGEFRKVTATVMADAKTAKLTSVEATAQTASIDTGVEKRDADLRSDAFFAADEYPTLTLKTKRITWKGDEGTAEVELTIRGVTKTVTFHGTLDGVRKVNFGSGDQLRAAYSATTTINRKDFGLKFNAIVEGVAVVSDEVTINIEAELYRAL